MIETYISKPKNKNITFFNKQATQINNDFVFQIPFNFPKRESIFEDRKNYGIRKLVYFGFDREEGIIQSGCESCPHCFGSIKYVQFKQGLDIVNMINER